MRNDHFLLRLLVVLTTVTIAPLALAQAEGDPLTNLQGAIDSLDRLIAEPPPEELTEEEFATWDEQTVWLRSVRDRYAEVVEDFDVEPESESVTTRSGTASAVTTQQTSQAVVADMAQKSQRFLALQNAVQQESRKYQTLSAAAKARHDVAMKSINNIRQ